MYDTTIKVGDLITAYHKGYWRVTKITPRRYGENDLKPEGAKAGDEYDPLFTYEKVLSADFKPCRKVAEECDASYCKKVTKEQLDKMIQQYTDGINCLRGLL
jgi:hypothetical protein